MKPYFGSFIWGGGLACRLVSAVGGKRTLFRRSSLRLGRSGLLPRIGMQRNATVAIFVLSLAMTTEETKLRKNQDVLPDEESVRLFENAYALEEQGQHDKALELRERLAQRYPKNERITIVVGRSLAFLGRVEEAESVYRKAIFMFPYSELASLQLFHFLWDTKRSDDAFNEMKRFQSISHSDDYLAIVKEILES